MKKVIQGSLYDTSTARKLGAAHADGSHDNPAYWEESIYRTNSGKYFLHGSGGSSSRYAQPKPDGSFGWGEKILPLSAEATQKWAEESLGISLGELESAVTHRTRISAALPDDLVEQLNDKSHQLGCSRTELIEKVLREYFS